MPDNYSHRPKVNDDSVGTIYVNKPKDGKQGYLNVTIDLDKLGVGGGIIKVMAFKNTFKTEDKHPDFRILKPKTAAGKTRPATVAPKIAANAASDDDSGLPF